MAEIDVEISPAALELYKLMVFPCSAISQRHQEDKTTLVLVGLHPTDRKDSRHRHSHEEYGETES